MTFLDSKKQTSKNAQPISMESEWVKKIREGDEKAFENLFNLYCQPLVNFACRYVFDLPVAENIVQDVFLTIWSKRVKLDPALNIKSYLYTAVKNQAFHHLRHVKVERSSADVIQTSVAPIRTPEDEWTEKEVTDTVHQAIAELPEKCRIIFSMNRFDRLTYAEIAEVLDISIKTVETQMGRALKYFRKRLSHYL